VYLLFNLLYLRGRLAQAEVRSYRLAVLEQAAVHASCLVCSATSTVTATPGTEVQRMFFERMVQQDDRVDEQMHILQFGGVVGSDFTHSETSIPTPSSSDSEVFRIIQDDAC